MHGQKSRASLATLITGTLTLAPHVASASGFALLEQSASRLGTAFAGTAAAADDATTLFFNPAGLTQLEGLQATAVASGIEITSNFRNASSAPAYGQPLGNQGGDAGDWNLVPAAYLSVPIAEGLVAGVGVNAPFGLKLVYDSGWIGRFQAVRSEIQTMNVNPSLAWRLNDRVSIAAGFSYQRLTAELTNAVNYSAVIAQGVQQLIAAGQLPLAAAPGVLASTTGLEGGVRVRGDDEAWGFNVGVLFDLSDTTRLGLAYRSSIEYEVRGSVRFSAPTVANPVGAAIVNTAAAVEGPLSSGPISVDLELPDSATLSLQQQLGDRLTLLADVGWTGWSSLQELRIVRNTGTVVSVTPEEWEDVWRYSLGASYELSDALTLRAGVAFDETPVPDETRTARLPDADRTWAAIGARWQPSEAIVVDFGYAHLFSDEAPLNQSEGNPLAYGLLNGEQHSDIDIVSTQLSYRF